MNLNANDIVSGAEQLLSSLQDGISLSDITSIVQLPQLDQFSQLASSLLPQNLVKVDESGTFSLLDPVSLQDTVKKGIDSVKGIIEEEIRGAIEQVTSVAGQVTDTLNTAADTLASLGQGNITESLDFFDDALGSASGLLGFSADAGTLSQYTKTVSDVTDTVKKLSPKQIRDLADPEFRENIVQTTLGKATELLESDVLSTVEQYVQLPVSVGAVTSLFTTANALLNRPGAKNAGETFNVATKVTTYYGKGPGADLDAYNKKSATGKQLISGKSCAVDNVNILYGSKVEVPGVGTFDAVDRIKGGGANLSLYYDTIDQAEPINSKLTGTMNVKVTPPPGSATAQQSIAEKRGQSAKLI